MQRPVLLALLMVFSLWLGVPADGSTHTSMPVSCDADFGFAIDSSASMTAPWTPLSRRDIVVRETHELLAGLSAVQQSGAITTEPLSKSIDVNHAATSFFLDTTLWGSGLSIIDPEIPIMRDDLATNGRPDVTHALVLIGDEDVMMAEARGASAPPFLQEVWAGYLSPYGGPLPLYPSAFAWNDWAQSGTTPGHYALLLEEEDVVAFYHGIENRYGVHGDFGPWGLYVAAGFTFQNESRVNLVWNSPHDACATLDEYEVYRRDSGGPWHLIGVTSHQDGILLNSFTDTLAPDPACGIHKYKVVGVVGGTRTESSNTAYYQGQYHAVGYGPVPPTAPGISTDWMCEDYPCDPTTDPEICYDELCSEVGLAYPCVPCVEPIPTDPTSCVSVGACLTDLSDLCIGFCTALGQPYPCMPPVPSSVGQCVPGLGCATAWYDLAGPAVGACANQTAVGNVCVN